MTFIYFIVNPISGKGVHNLTEHYIKTFFSIRKFRIEVVYTEYKEHAIELTKKAVALNPDCIVACGGDGTINEVASCLVNTTINLGIIPVGSGNGLAANLKLPKDINTAIKVVRAGNTTAIDIGKINNNYFFSNTGLGIDAMIIRNYEKSGKRTLLSYIKSSLKASFQFRAKTAIITYGDKKHSINPMLLFISNSNEMGYNMSLTPKANLQDGMLDFVTVPELSILEKISLGYRVLTNTIEKFKKANYILVKELSIEIPEKLNISVQIDGEYHFMNTNQFSISVIQNGLNVII